MKKVFLFLAFVIFAVTVNAQKPVMWVYNNTSNHITYYEPTIAGLIPIDETKVKHGLFRSFLKPVTANDFIEQPKTRSVIPGVVNQLSYNDWLILPDLAVTALYMDLKTFQTSAFQQAGLGIGINHFKSVDGLPFNDYGFKLLLLGGPAHNLNDVGVITNKFDFSVAVVANALGLVNLGPIIDTRTKHLGVLLNVSITINKIFN